LDHLVIGSGAFFHKTVAEYNCRIVHQLGALKTAHVAVAAMRRYRSPSSVIVFCYCQFCVTGPEGQKVRLSSFFHAQVAWKGSGFASLVSL
jgi:hypothetical protein